MIIISVQFIFSDVTKAQQHPTSVAQTSSAPNLALASPPQAVAPNTAASTVAPGLTPPPSLGTPAISTSTADASTTATTMSTPAAIATLSPATAATAIATPTPATPTATAGTEPTTASSTASPFAIGDHVRVQLELEIFRVLQEGHGGWMDDMAEVKLSVAHVSLTDVRIHT